MIFDYIRKEEFELRAPMFYFGISKNTSLTICNFGNKQRIKNNLELLFINLLARTNGETESNKEYSELTTILINELKNMVYTKLDLTSISNKLFYTKSYICRKFKEDTGVTLAKFYYDLKMTEAKNMLLNTSKTLSEISKELDFKSVQYFNYIFNLYDYFLGDMLLHGTGIGNYQTAEGREEGI